MVDDEITIRTKFTALRPVMDERLTRLWAGAEADALGDGGIAIVERATGLSRTTIRAGRDELRAGVTPDEVVLVRRAGGGRPRLEETTPGLVEALETLVDPVTRGDPESPLRWTAKSTRTLATELTAQGYPVSPQKVGQLLATSGYSLQAAQKTIEGTSHPDRNEQFEFINDRVDGFHGRGAPVISVDTKKKELVGAFKNAGREWQPSGEPVPVRVHDFVDDTLGKVIPYGGVRRRAEHRLGQCRHRSRYAGLRRGIHRSVVAVHGETDVPRCARTSHHGRRGRQQQRPVPPVEDGVAAPRGPHGAGHQRLALSARHLQMEQNRASVVLPHHRKLARSPAARPRDGRPTDWQRPHDDGAHSQSETRHP